MDFGDNRLQTEGVARSRRASEVRRCQFSLRTLFLLTVLLSLPLSWVGLRLRQRADERKIQAELGDGVFVFYDYPAPTEEVHAFFEFLDCPLFETLEAVRVQRPLSDTDWELIKTLDPPWLIVLRDAYWSDGDFSQLRHITSLRQLYLEDPEITDSRVRDLRGLHRLRLLNFSETQVTDECVRDLRRALPDCEVYN